MEYLTAEKPEGCIFCYKLSEDRDRENLILFRGEKAFLMLNLYPYNSGHLMVIPHAHVPTLEVLDKDTLLEMMLLINKGLCLLREVMHPDGFNVGANIGKAAGAGISEHVHIHIVPRWEGDTSFMTIFSETRVVPELLDDTYVKLKAALQSLDF